jgi:hypothetical protein
VAKLCCYVHAGVARKCHDSDNDSVCDNVDNCIHVANPDQQDSDDDHIGDMYDTISPVLSLLGMPSPPVLP